MFNRSIVLPKFLIVSCATILLFFSTALNAEKEKELFNLENYIKSKFIGEPLDQKYGIYEELEFTGKYAQKLQYSNIRATAGRELVYRFIQRKSTLSKYPGKAIEGMAWMEILYNEMIKNPNVSEKSITPMWEARNDMRYSMGFDTTLSTQEVMDRYLLLSKILSGATTIKQDISPGLKARRHLLKVFKNDLKAVTKTYLASINTDEIKLATDLRQDALTDTTAQTTSEDVEQSISFTSSSDIKTKERLIELKELLELGLISEEEFQTKRKEILDGL